MAIYFIWYLQIKTIISVEYTPKYRLIMITANSIVIYTEYGLMNNTILDLDNDFPGEYI
jgi:hypothetical protein